MDITNQRKTWSLDTVEEIIEDLFCFDLILEIKRRMKSEEAKTYVSNFLRVLAPIYVHEIANALDRFGIIAKEKLLEPNISKRVKEERQLSAHKTIVNSNSAMKAIAEMGISFERKVYDLNIVTKNGTLYDFNFETQVSPVNDLAFWNFLFGVPRTMLTAAFSVASPDFNFQDIYENSRGQLDSIAAQLDQVLSLTRHAYSTHKLFQHSANLEIADKILILYRFRMITAVNILSEHLPSLHAARGNRRIVDTNYFFGKYRALIITILGDELRHLNTPFAERIKTDIGNVIKNSSFFPLNRKLRNNLHYETTSILTESEWNIVQQNQKLYLGVIENSFRSQLCVNIDKECRTMTGFSNAFRASGMSKEELDKYYYFYYLKYRITSKL